jgi:hypothetical protein
MEEQAMSSSPAIELCQATYKAEQVPGQVMVHATGYHSISGYQAFFEQLPSAVPPPVLQLWHTKPSGPVLDVITPFAITTTFPASGKISAVTVVDSAGKHTVSVEQAQDHS